MKVGIMTFPNSRSHGAALQMYGLYLAVGELGYEAQIINYHNSYMKAERHSSRGARSGIRSWAKQLLHYRQFSGFRRFEKRMVLEPKNPIQSPEALRTMSDEYGCVICGSDQVWNPDITGGDLSYFLDFCGEGTRRVSYAPSFGVETLEEPFASQAARELSRFDALSVREDQGKVLVEKLTGKTPQVVADPTFLVSPEVWAEQETPCCVPQEGYILYYTIRSSGTLMEFCRDLSERTGLKILIVGGNSLRNLVNRDERIRYVCDADPGQWLYLLRHARYVVTNSFHGTAFSVNFRKDFYVEFSSLTNSRLEHIIRTLGLEERIVGSSPVEKVTPVDYTRTEQVLPRLRTDSLEYLKNAIEGTL